MRETIREKYDDLRDNLYKDYDKVYVIDNYDFYRSNAYTIFYLNKNESFKEFKKLWNKTLDENISEDYDTILDEFNNIARDKFDYVELGTLDIYTRNDYDLQI